MVRFDWFKAGAVGAVLTAVFVQSAAAQVTCSVTVTGLDDPALDAAAVQAAINSQGIGIATVCLQGTFDFGTPVPPATNSVSIVASPFVTSLSIVGLDDAKGRKATIRNGVQALTKQGANPPFFSIENLKFEGPALSAISILGNGPTGQIRLTGLRIAGVKSFLFTAFNAKFREGIAITNGVGPVGGDIEISNNVVDGGTYTVDDTTLAASTGILVSGAVGGGPPTPSTLTARVRISDNKVLNWSGSSIHASGVNQLTIERNVIQPGAFANVNPPGCVSPGNGMGAAAGITLASVSDSTVRDNVITLDPALTGQGTPPQCTAGMIVSGPANIGLRVGNGNVLYRNRIRGTGTYGIVLGLPLAASAETENLFALNGLANFEPQSAALFLGAGAIDNDLVGNFASIEGNEAGNLVISRP